MRKMLHKKLVSTNSEKGQSLTELAISLTFLLILLGGVVDLGRAFFTYITLRDAAQEGALYGSYYVYDKDLSWCGIVKRVRETSNTPFNLNDVTVDVKFASDPGTYTFNKSDPYDPGSCPTLAATPSAGDEVQVTVTYKDFQITMPFMGALIGSQKISISASIKDRVVTNAPN